MNCRRVRAATSRRFNLGALAAIIALVDRTLIQSAARLLKQGRLVAFPTETVYGLGADATNPDAVRKIFAVKGRPATNPLIVHIAGIEQARRYCLTWPTDAQRLADAFWPGPLTIVLPRSPRIVPDVSAGLDTVGLRCPKHPLALELLREFDGPIAAPSANRSNRVSPTTAAHVREELGDQVDLILDGGPCDIGIESTVITLCTPAPTILRPGHITAEDLGDVLGQIPAIAGSSAAGPQSSPGQLPIHYAPTSPTYLAATSLAALTYLSSHLDQSIIYLAITSSGQSGAPRHHIVRMPCGPEAYAQHLYAALRSADARRPDQIIIESPPLTAGWVAVHDRLRRATRPL